MAHFGLDQNLIGLGRLPSIDPRNAEHPMPKRKAPTALRRQFWTDYGPTDQRSTPHCVGHAGYGWLRCAPIVNKPKQTPTQLYQLAQQHDEWPGSNYDGTSVLGLMKAFKKLGYVDEYVWAKKQTDIVAWLLTTGPVVVGTTWTVDMFMPDAKGFITPTGDSVGGHAYRLVGADRDVVCPDKSKGAVRIVNSWGWKWGQNGRAWISFKDLQRLLDDNGEAATALERKR